MLMGRKPEFRFNYIRKNARFVEEVTQRPSGAGDRLL
jgi:hypothetical protein